MTSLAHFHGQLLLCSERYLATSLQLQNFAVALCSFIGTIPPYSPSKYCLLLPLFMAALVFPSSLPHCCLPLPLNKPNTKCKHAAILPSSSDYRLGVFWPFVTCHPDVFVAILTVLGCEEYCDWRSCFQITLWLADVSGGNSDSVVNFHPDVFVATLPVIGARSIVTGPPASR